MLGDVPRGQDDRPAELHAGRWATTEPSSTDVGDAPAVAVADPAAPQRRSRRSLRRVMIRSPTDAGVPSARRTSRLGDGVAVEDPLGAGALVERDDGCGRLGDQHAARPASVSARQAAYAASIISSVVPSATRSCADVGADDLGAAEAEVERRGLLPLVGEAVDLGQFGRVGRARRRAARTLRRRRPTGVAPSRRPAAPSRRPRPRCGDPVERQGAGEGGLVDDHELARLRTWPGRGRTRGATWRCSRIRCRGPRPGPAAATADGASPTTLSRPVLRRPGPSQGVHRRGLPARPGRPAGRPGARDARCFARASACSSLRSGVDLLRATRLDDRRGRRLGASSAARCEQPCLGGERSRRRVARPSGAGRNRLVPSSRRNISGLVASSGGVSVTDGPLGLVDDQPDDLLAVRGAGEPPSHRLPGCLGPEVPVRQVDRFSLTAPTTARADLDDGIERDVIGAQQPRAGPVARPAGDRRRPFGRAPSRGCGSPVLATRR